MACGRLERLRSRRDRPDPPRSKAARRLLVRLLKKKGLAPKRIITDKLRLYGAARRDVMPVSDIERTRALTIAQRTLTCRFEYGCG